MQMHETITLTRRQLEILLKGGIAQDNAPKNRAYSSVASVERIHNEVGATGENGRKLHEIVIDLVQA